MEKVNRAKGRELFVDEERNKIIHPANILKNKKPEEWEEMGIYYRYGRWAKEETDKLMQNWESFLKENPAIEDPLKLFDKGQNQEAIQLAKQTDFFLHISESLNRSTHSCYTKLQRLVHRVKFKTQKFSEKEIKKLKKYINKYGNNYKKIAKKMGRDRQSVQDKIRLLEKETAVGHWTEEEDDLLLKTVREVTGVDDLGQLRKMEIPWRRIARRMPSRHEEQCRSHFLNIKKWKLHDDSGNCTKFSKWNKRLLVEKLIEENYDVETDIDWGELQKFFEKVSPTSSHLQRQFHQMKSHVTDYQKKTLSELLERMLRFYPERTVNDQDD